MAETYGTATGESGETVTISGDIASVVYTNEENGYSVVEVELEDGGVITAVGTIPYPGEGESIFAEGTYTTHAVYGSQFRCDHVDRMLPGIDIGDLLVIHDAGAHGLAMGYNYNGKLRCAEVLLQPDGSTRLIRRAETPEDYFATMVWDD